VDIQAVMKKLRAKKDWPFVNEGQPGDVVLPPIEPSWHRGRTIPPEDE
jgi:hypothetical protein